MNGIKTIVTIDGIDGAGKTKTAEALSALTGWHIYHGDAFDGPDGELPEALERRRYAHCLAENYRIAEEIARESCEGVILDRSIFSTIAYHPLASAHSRPDFSPSLASPRSASSVFARVRTRRPLPPAG